MNSSWGSWKEGIGGLFRDYEGRILLQFRKKVEADFATQEVRKGLLVAVALNRLVCILSFSHQTRAT